MDGRGACRVRIRPEPSNETGGPRTVRSSAAWHRAPRSRWCRNGRGPSRWRGSPLTGEGCGPCVRPRALAVRWGHERLVGCRALSSAIRERACPAGSDQEQVRGNGKERSWTYSAFDAEPARCRRPVVSQMVGCRLVWRRHTLKIIVVVAIRLLVIYLPLPRQAIERLIEESQVSSLSWAGPGAFGTGRRSVAGLRVKPRSQDRADYPGWK
jgi:hypothetical protein